MEKSLELEVQELVSDILEDYKSNRDIDRMEDFFNQPDKDVIIDIVNKMLRILFPGYYRDKSYRVYNAASQLSMQIEDVMYYLSKEIVKVLKYSSSYGSGSEEENRNTARKYTAWRQNWNRRQRYTTPFYRW